jgi:site-specific DNA-cytosine methylase
MNNLEIKWACIQPLTGGMYLGAEEAIGHPAEFILSFNGLDNASIKKDGSFGNVSNEHYLKTYLTKKERMPLYYQIDGDWLNMSEDNVTIKLNGEISNPDYSNLDLVVAVPICAGLSKASSASDEVKDLKNNNMRFITTYTLKTIKPKIYIFENAPGLMGTMGDEMRKELEDLAYESGYSILYYKTDTLLHHNCQHRLRTFIIFYKHRGTKDIEDPMLLGYEHVTIPIKEYFNNIDNILNPESPDTPSYNWIVLDFVRQEYGENWRDKIPGSLMAPIIKDKKLNKLISYAKEHGCSDKGIYYFEKIKRKKGMNMNYYHMDLRNPSEYMAPVQGRSIRFMLHPVEDRICCVREYLALMGMPNDFEWYGDLDLNVNKIGQNVPVKTAKFIVSECVKHLLKWDVEPIDNNKNSGFQDNIQCLEIW